MSGLVHLWRPHRFSRRLSQRPEAFRGRRGGTIKTFSETTAAHKKIKGTDFRARRVARRLFAKSQLLNDRGVPISVLTRQILQQLVSAAHELQQSPPRGMVLLMRIEVRSQLIDPLGQYRDLHFRRPRGVVVGPILIS